MKKLYILGNGFDIHHGLKTRYADFHRYVSENHIELENNLERYFSFEFDANYLWRSFESDLCNFDNQHFFDSHNHIDVLSESFKPSERFGLEDDIAQDMDDMIQSIKDVFQEWIESIEFPEVEDISSMLLKFNPDSIFLNFNYTETLERLYQVTEDRILYIHNNATGRFGELIFGHAQDIESNPKIDELDTNGDSTRTMFTDAEDAARSAFYAFQKDTHDVLERHRNFFDSLTTIDEVVVLGHSLGEVDWPYFKTIALKTPKAIWKIGYHGDEADKKLQFDKAYHMLNSVTATFDLIKISDLL